jgi:hypothetical protein
MLHQAFTVSGLADMGPMLPMLDKQMSYVWDKDIKPVAQALMAADGALAS